MTGQHDTAPGADTIDGMLPPQMALACESAGAAKAGRGWLALLVLGLLGGAFIALGAIKVMVVVPPVAAFVAAGFEHSIANLYLLPYGLAVKTWAEPEFWAAIGQTAGAYPTLTAGGVLHNIVVATVGNLAGGSLMVGAVYWFVHLRRRAH